ncbi:7-methylguanosine phosphate-specific 5'-nucleotidase [Strongyloides ratti]|uniref:5'-nucleotidase n=1 Tax=Strongyloides ratti TaxID=34506 RepID=A0A090LH80_STRRB|nr:7-methylguanosine phosphate-specific 5'-nucleotidase [Strongyloides ratti]CEF67488.1 7-methylguanosine phosphate-specific 5'-nucleotidase [Strongyloides ratti]
MDFLINNSKVFIKNKEYVSRIINVLSNDGAKNLTVISDFDYTISRFRDDNGNQNLTTHQLFKKGTEISNPNLGPKLSKLFDKYFPIEFSNDLTIKEKIPHMEEWWNLSHGAIIDEKLDYDFIVNIIKSNKLEYRYKFCELVKRLNYLNVPFVIFSAGIGDVIDIYLRKQIKLIEKNIYIISNSMIFNNDNICVGFSEPLIHTFSKNSSVIKKSDPLRNVVKDRKNVLLMGDSFGDITMEVNSERKGNTLKVGFLNIIDNNLLEKYMNFYDIVCVDDQTMDVPFYIIKIIENGVYVEEMYNVVI